MSFTYGHILRGSAEDNVGGYYDRVLFIPASIVTTAPTLTVPATTDDDYCVAKGAFTFVAGKKPTLIQCAPNSVDYSAENQGEECGQSFRQKGEFFHPGSKKIVSAFSRAVNNESGYVVIQEKTGEQIIIGQPNMLAQVKPSFAGGKKVTDLRGYKFEFEADAFAPTIYLATPVDFDALLTSGGSGS